MVRHEYYALIDWVGGPNSVIKHVIIWPQCFSFFFCFCFFSGNKIRYRNIHLRRSFWPKRRDLYSNKVVLVRILCALLIKSPYEVVRDSSRAGRIFPALLAPSRTALIRGFSQQFYNESARGAVRVIYPYIYKSISVICGLIVDPHSDQFPVIVSFAAVFGMSRNALAKGKQRSSFRGSVAWHPERLIAHLVEHCITKVRVRIPV